MCNRESGDTKPERERESVIWQMVTVCDYISDHNKLPVNNA